MTAALNSDSKAFLDEAQWSKDVDFGNVSIAEARQRCDAQFEQFGAPVRSVRKTLLERVPTDDGEVPVYLSWPEAADNSGSLPLLIWFHGGGWTVGTARANTSISHYLCAQAQVIVANVEYRLAPEWPFPTGPNDAFAVFRWLTENAGALGVDTSRISVAGASAGAHLAAVLCQMARDTGGVQPDFQALFYPCVSLQADPPYASRKLYGTGEFGLTLTEINWVRECFLRNEGDALDPRASPILALDWTGLPSALIVTAECDPLVDEGEDYARRLANAGVQVEYRVFKGAVHGFAEIPGRLPQGLEALDLLVDRLRHRFHSVSNTPGDHSGPGSK